MTRVPAWVIDAVLALAVAVIVTMAIVTATEPDSVPPGHAFAYALGLALAGLVLFRRRWPVGVLLASVATLLVYYSLDYPGFSPALALAVALYTTAAAGHLRWSLVVTALVIVAGYSFRLSDYQERPLQVVASALQDGTLLIVVFLLGDAVRSRRALVAEARERARLESAEREQEAQRRVADERLRIARELHDVIAHTVALITVQAGVAADVLDESPDVAKSALQTIRAASREAMDELRSTVGLLRESGRAAAPLAPAPGLEQLEGLVDMATATGLEVKVSLSGDPRALPAAIDLTAYRIVQESLTNVLRHAGATTATVAIDYLPNAVVIEVGDDGKGSGGSQGAGAGYGLAGMRERATALGGRFQAGPAPGGGFHVRAWLPTERNARP